MKTVQAEPNLLGFIEYLQGNVWALLLFVPIAVVLAWWIVEYEERWW